MSPARIPPPVPREVLELVGPGAWELLSGGESHASWVVGGLVVRASEITTAPRSRHAVGVSGVLADHRLAERSKIVWEEPDGVLWSTTPYLPGHPLSERWDLLASPAREQVVGEVTAWITEMHRLPPDILPAPPYRTFLPAPDPRAAAALLVDELARSGALDAALADALHAVIADLGLGTQPHVPLHMDAHRSY